MTKLTKSILNRLARTGINNQSAGQKLIANLKLEKDEFTRHESVRQLTLEFLQSATDFEHFYQGGKKKLVIEFASALEEDLKRRGEDGLICKISSFIIKLVEQVELGWSDDYLRRVLSDKYKDPISQASALKRKSEPKQKSLPESNALEEIRPYEKDMEIKAAIPYDSRESLIKDLVNTNAKSRNRTRTFQFNDKDYNGKVSIEVNLPITIKVDPKEQSVTYELDKEVIEARNRLDLQQKEERKQKKRKQEHKSKDQPLQEQQINDVEIRPCFICKQPGLRYKIELMPQTGILWGTKHDDGKICKWPEFRVSHIDRGQRTSETIEDCPVCHKKGRINDTFLEEAEFANMQYVVTHDGKKGGCHIVKQEHRDVILKELGRYIEPPTEIKISS